MVAFVPPVHRYIRIVAAVASLGLLGSTSTGAQGGLPTAFGKIAPAIGATTASLQPTLSWSASSGAAFGYEYCLDTTNDNACTTWEGAGLATSATPGGLLAGTTYYWQIRARNANGLTYADSGETAFWSFTTPSSPPEAFSKFSPANGATGQNANLGVTWRTSVGATTYEYCYDTTNDNSCAAWTSAGPITSGSLNGLSSSTTYYWYVRANNAFGTTYADGGAPWAFVTQAEPGAFTKTGPANGSSGLSFSSVTLSWNASAGVSNYEFCYDTTNDNACSTWGSLGTSTTTNLGNLSAGTTYYWQVRATNLGGSIYADGSASAFWSFTTAGAPGPFAKVGPSDGQLGVPLNGSIYWNPSAGSTGYEYCYDTTNDGACSNWIATDDQFGSLTDLIPNTVYYWQVRAATALGVTYADGGPTAFWSFTSTPVVPEPPCNVLLLNGTTAQAAAAGTVFPISGSPASFTVEAWIRPYASQNSTRFQSIVADQGYSLFLEEEVAGVLRLGVALHPDSVTEFLYSPADSRYLTLDQWHHVALVYDDVTKQLRIGLDGVLSGPFSVPNIDFAASGRSLTVGSWGDSLQFNGFVDNVRISSIARYTSNTYTPSRNLVTDADTRALYQFGEAAGSTTFADESGSGHTLTGTGGAQTTAGGGCLELTAPTVIAIVPNTGPTTGGTLVGITGTQFQPGATVTIGGALATGVSVNSPTSISATTTAGPAGLANVEVTNPDAKLGTLVNGFTYFTALPAAFSKIGPGNGVAGVKAALLSWAPSARATSYEYCVDTTNDDACAAWTNVGLTTLIVATGLASDTTYYWQVRAINGTGTTDANGGVTDFWSFTTGTIPSLPDFRDLNGDGKPDLVWEQASGSRYVWFLDGTTLSSGAYLSPSAMDPALTIRAVNDFTGDGKPDLLMESTTDRTVTLFRMDGVNHVGSQTIQGATNTLWRVVASGDFNRDGKPDIVWQNFTNGQIYIWFMSSSGGAAIFGGVGGVFGGDFVRDAGFNIVSMGGMVVAGAGDVDLDGDEDLVLQDWNTGALRVWYMNGTVRTSTGSISPGAVDPNWKIKTVGDYNGDGKADFIFEHTNGSLYIWFMERATLSGGTYLTPPAVNPAWQIVGPR